MPARGRQQAVRSTPRFTTMLRTSIRKVLHQNVAEDPKKGGRALEGCIPAALNSTRPTDAMSSLNHLKGGRHEYSPQPHVPYHIRPAPHRGCLEDFAVPVEDFLQIWG